MRAVVGPCGGPGGRKLLLAEVFLLPGADSFCMVRVYSGPELSAAFTFVLDAGGVPVPAAEGARPVSGVTLMSAVASVSSTHRAAEKAVFLLGVL